MSARNASPVVPYDLQIEFILCSVRFHGASKPAPYAVGVGVLDDPCTKKRTASPGCPCGMSNIAQIAGAQCAPLPSKSKLMKCIPHPPQNKNPVQLRTGFDCVENGFCALKFQPNFHIRIGRHTPVTARRKAYRADLRAVGQAGTLKLIIEKSLDKQPKPTL